MAGPPRRLALDVARFESHIGWLAEQHAEAMFDLRADAYGLGLANVSSIFDKLGVTILVDEDQTGATRDGVATFGENGQDSELIPGDVVLGLSNGGRGFARLTGTVVRVKRVPAGRRISYGYTYATAHESTVALIALGYADGVLRRASNVAPVRIGSHTGIIAGRIAMDQFVVDMGDAPVSPGDTAVLFGSSDDDPSISRWSDVTGVPALAIMAGLGSRITRLNSSAEGDA